MTFRIVGTIVIATFLSSLTVDSLAENTLGKTNCASVCTEAWLSGDHWLLVTLDSSGEILEFHQSEVPATEPLDLWLESMAWNSKDAKNLSVPPPPAGGTGQVTENSDSPGYNTLPNGNQVYGTWFISITYVFVDYELVDVRSTTHFQQSPVPPPGDDQVN